MTDNSELKRLAEAAPGGPWVPENDSLYFKDGGYTRHLLDSDAGHDVEPEAYYAALKFIAAANPAAVLALIAENDSQRKDLQNLRADNAQLLYALKQEEQSYLVLRAERDQLKAENEALRTGVKGDFDLDAWLDWVKEAGALRKMVSETSLELRKASSWICREVEAGTQSATHWAIRLREKADRIDVALGKGEQP